MNNRPTAADRPLRYEIRVLASPAIIPITKFDRIPLALCSPSPPGGAVREFMQGLVMKHQDDVMKSQSWVCWNCSAPAMGMVHTPTSYMHLPEPRVVDFVQPICVNGGKCDIAAQKMMAEEMAALSVPEARA